MRSIVCGQAGTLRFPPSGGEPLQTARAVHSHLQTKLQAGGGVNATDLMALHSAVDTVLMTRNQGQRPPPPSSLATSIHVEAPGERWHPPIRTHCTAPPPESTSIIGVSRQSVTALLEQLMEALNEGRELPEDVRVRLVQQLTTLLQQAQPVGPDEEGRIAELMSNLVRLSLLTYA